MGKFRRVHLAILFACSFAISACSPPEAGQDSDHLNDFGTEVSLKTEALSPWIGETKVLVIRASNLTVDVDNMMNGSLEGTRSVMNQVSDFYKEASYGKMWLKTDIVGPYTVPITREQCNNEELTSKAIAAAKSAGVNLSQYNRIIVHGPCRRGGGQVVNSGLWVGTMSLRVIAHELGHLLGKKFGEAGDLYCPNSTDVIAVSCGFRVYKDWLDVMGDTWVGFNFSAGLKESIGWLGSPGFPDIQTVTTSGVYSIDVYETLDRGLPKALKVPVKIPNTTGFYYLEYRQPIGFDSGLAPFASAVNGAVVHLGTIQLLDMTPATKGAYDHPLVVGKSFTDAGGLTIKVLSADGQTLRVQITIPGTQETGTPTTSPTPTPTPTPVPTPAPTPTPTPTCSRATPDFSLTLASISASAGEEVSYTIRVKNNDSAVCTATNFTIRLKALPSGFTSGLTPSVLSLAPGALGTATLKLKSPLAAGAGTYRAQLEAKHSVTAGVVLSPATYVVNPIATPTPLPSPAPSPSPLPPPSTSGNTFNDNFNRPDSIALENTWLVTSGGLKISENRVANALANGHHIAIQSGFTGTTLRVSGEFTRVSGSGASRLGVILRYQDAKNYYFIGRQTGGSSLLVVIKVQGGIETIVGSASTPNPTADVPFKITGRAEGSLLSIEVNGVPQPLFQKGIKKNAVTDSTFASGAVGLAIGHPTLSQSSEVRVDDFSSTR